MLIDFDFTIVTFLGQLVELAVNCAVHFSAVVVAVAARCLFLVSRVLVTWLKLHQHCPGGGGGGGCLQRVTALARRIYCTADCPISVVHDSSVHQEFNTISAAYLVMSRTGEFTVRQREINEANFPLRCVTC
jgi:hypothetical protein